MEYQRLWRLCVTSTTHLRRKRMRTSMPHTRYHKSWSSRIAMPQRATFSCLCGVSREGLRNCFGKRILSRCCYFIYGIAKSVAVYGGLNFGREWNVLRFACICDGIIRRMLTYWGFFRADLLRTGGIRQAFEGARNTPWRLTRSTVVVASLTPITRYMQSLGSLLLYPAVTGGVLYENTFENHHILLEVQGIYLLQRTAKQTKPR